MADLRTASSTTTGSLATTHSNLLAKFGRHVPHVRKTKRWTDEAFDYNRDPAWPNEDHLDENGKSKYLFPHELDPMYR